MAGERSMDNMETLTEMDLEKLDNMDYSNMDVEDLMDAKKKLLAMLESDELSEDVRNGLRAMLTGNTPFGGYNGATGVLLALGLAVITFSIILFFGYKLYKSIRDKEKKKEEKKKAKQQKKKK